MREEMRNRMLDKRVNTEKEQLERNEKEKRKRKGKGKGS